MELTTTLNRIDSCSPCIQGWHMLQIPLPPLYDGEIHVGIIGNASGDYYHLILLPGDNDDANWQAQMDWAQSIGGYLPDRVEQAMLFKHACEQFKDDWYWSNEHHNCNSDYAWYQRFDQGNQNISRKTNELRARAVRRLSI